MIVWAVVGAVAGVAIGGLVAWLVLHRKAEQRIASIEAEWSKRWRFEEARLLGRVKLVEDQRDAATAARDAAWWKWLEALAAGKIPLAEAMRNAPAPRPGTPRPPRRDNPSRPAPGDDVDVQVDDTARASK